LSNYMQGLTAKVFRTYNASWTMARLLQDMKAVGTHAEKVKAYNDANRKVAILCNHKRTVATGHAAQMEKAQDKIDAVRYQQYRVKQMMLALDSKLKKKKGAEWFALPEGLDEEWQKKHHEDLVEQERQKITKKFEKENEKLTAEGEKEMKSKELDENSRRRRLSLKARDLLSRSMKAKSRNSPPELATWNCRLRTERATRKSLWELPRSTTSTPASLSSSPRSSMCPLRSSFPRPCARSLHGPLLPLMRTGSSKHLRLGR
jgi:hypothetical protein